MTAVTDLRILVVEDDEGLLEVMSSMLRKRGAVVSSALNGSAALAMLQAKEFDLVLSDVQMPVMDGIELLEKMKLMGDGRPVLLYITGQAVIDEPTSLRNGAAGLIQKPFRITDLFSRIEALEAAGLIPEISKRLSA